MIRGIIVIFILMLSCSLLRGQESPAYGEDALRDYQWISGVWESSTLIDFGGDSVSLDSIYNPLLFSRALAMISDSEGELLFYSNGMALFDNDYDSIPNGSPLSLYEEYYNWYETNPIPQGVLILPRPDSMGLYDVLVSDLGDFQTSTVARVLHTLVRKVHRDSAASVLSKNEVVLEAAQESEGIQQGMLTACRHGNGRDWWILVFDKNQKSYTRLLLQPSGIEVLAKDSVDTEMITVIGQAVFSPDGTKFIRNGANKAEFSFDSLVPPISVCVLDIFDFDRCTGLLSNQQHHTYSFIDYNVPEGFPPQPAVSGTVAISPNSRYAYPIAASIIFQIDLASDAPWENRDTVLIHDGVMPDGLLDGFFLAQLAPDNKIYLSSSNGAKSYHVIHQPDEAGAACEAEIRGFPLPRYNTFAIPNYPYYRLGQWEDSACDSLYVTSSIAEPLEDIKDLQVYPNPTSGDVRILLGEKYSEATRIELSDISGRHIASYTLAKGEKEKSLSLSEKGVYLLRVYSTDGQLSNIEKIIVQ